MKKLVALDTIKKGVVKLEVSGNRLLVEPYQGKEEHTHVLTYSHHDSHTHPTFYSMFFGALKPVMLNESTNKEEILERLRAREGEGPLVAYEYKRTAGITAEDLEEFDGYVLLVDSSMHGGVANRKLLEEVGKRKKGLMFGEANKKETTEDYHFLAMSILEEQVADRGVEELVAWVKKRVAEGTTSFEDKIIFTETEWEVFKEAAVKIERELGYQPIKAVYVKHSLLMKNPKKFAEEGEMLGITVGAKWVCDGALGTKTAALESYRYTDGTVGQLTLPLVGQDRTAISGYIGSLLDSGIDKLACHAIGDKAIEAVLSMVSRFQQAGIMISIEHFELPTSHQITKAAELGVPLHMQLNFSTEVWRYASWMGYITTHINPMRDILEEYGKRGHRNMIHFGTDGMPQSMLWAIACGVLHPIQSHRLTLAEAIEHSKDPQGLLVLEKDTFQSLTSMDLKTATENREASAAELHKGVVLVTRDDRIIHSTL